MGINPHLETYSVKQELIQLAKDKFKIADTKKLLEKMQDLKHSLEINKKMLESMLGQE